MTNWKQIQGRIRRAKAGADPAGQLEQLFEKTHDAMAAFELARHLEGASQGGDAVRWYAIAAERFRRADWKKRAEEAATRLNGGVPLGPAVAGVAEPSAHVAEEQPPTQAASDASADLPGPATGTPSTPGGPALSAADPAGQHRGRGRRGRRGGRNRRRGRERHSEGSQLPEPATPAAPVAEATPEPEGGLTERDQREQERPEPERPNLAETLPAHRGRSGDPALSSRLAQLEMQLRRLLACPPAQIEKADRAPAGPGVLLVSDSDLITNYYVESCATLRIGVANLLRGGARRGEDSLKERFADHLGIPEARVTKYLKDHCIVRWLQLDEGAKLFAYFTIAVLRPVLNE